MGFFTSSCLILMLFSTTDYFTLLAHKLVFLQHLCLKASPVLESDKVLWQALVCARNINSDSPWKNWLQFSGLIHLFVVSGSHFIVLQWILKKLRAPLWMQFLGLWFYNALTGFSAPGTRACLNVSVGFLFPIRSDQKLFAIGLLCLALEPSWVQSYSFWLSWMACLILFCTPVLKIDVIRAFVFYFVWLILGFSISFWSVPLNLLLGPLIGWVLFPLAFLSFIPGVPEVFHFCIGLLEKALQWVNQDNQTLGAFPKIINLLAGWVLITHLILQGIYLHRRGQKFK